MLATLQRQLCLRLASCALQSQHNLLRRLCLLVEHRLCLTTVTGLLAIITTLSLREKRCLSCLVLRHLVLGVLSAILALAVGASGFGNVDLFFVVSLTSDAFQLSQSPAPCAQSIKFYPAEPPTSYSRSFRHRICPMEYEVVAARSR